MSSILSVKGQITIPKNLRDRLDLRAGDQIAFEFDQEGSIRITPVRKVVKKTAKSKFAALVGSRSKGGRTAELMDMLRDYSNDKDDPGFR